MRHRSGPLAGRDKPVASPAGTTLAALCNLANPAIAHLFAADGAPRLLIDRTGMILRATEARPGLTPSGWRVGRHVLEVLSPESRIGTWHHIEGSMIGGGPPPGPVPSSWTAEDGPPTKLHVWISPVIEQSGVASGTLLRFQDVTKEFEIEASVSNGQKLQAIGALAGGIAHDFNNLLQAISGAAESLNGRCELSEQAREEVAEIASGATRGRALVRQLLAFARQQTLMPQVVAVNEAVRALEGLLKRMLGERWTLCLNLEEPGRYVLVDPGQLDQVVVNLVVNARDAMAGGGRVTICTGKKTVFSPEKSGGDIVPAGRYVTIDVVDSGTGIAPEILPKIFEPFFTTGRANGTGLGLSTVLGIVRQSHGFVQVFSEPGVGTTMRILLPRAEPAALEVATQRTPTVAPRANAGRLILFVEDEDPIRRIDKRALEKAGWEVVAAESGEEALELVAACQRPIDAIVSDMVMPGMDGASLVREVRQRLSQPALPAIIVSGYAESQLRQSISEIATTFLPKPYAMRELVEQLGSLLNQRDQDVADGPGV